MTTASEAVEESGLLDSLFDYELAALEQEDFDCNSVYADGVEL